MDLYTLTLPLDASAGATLRTWLSEVLETNSASPDAAHEIVLAAAEAVNSAIRNTALEGTTVVVTLSIVGSDVYVRVVDRERPDPAAGSADDAFGIQLADELGMTLMHGLMDQVDLHRDGDETTVRLVKRLRLPSPAAAQPTAEAGALEPGAR